MTQSHFFKKTMLKTLGVGFLAATMGAGGTGMLGGHGGDHGGGGDHQPHTRREEEFIEQREELEAVSLTKQGQRTLNIGGTNWYVYPVPVAKA